MRSLLAAILFLTSLPLAHAALNAWTFRVLLDGREIGRHQFTLRDAGEARELRSEARFDVRVLFLSVYRYQHDALERWEGNCLQSLVASTETNGERQTVNAAARGGRLVVERPEGRDEHDGCVMSFAYWNPQILKARRLLNSQTGELLPVRITLQGAETVEVRGQPLATQRHRISGPSLQIDLWYTGEQWIALETLAQGGRRLRYELM
jgi:uncharacterized protein YjhX (UPF0386 family)